MAFKMKGFPMQKNSAMKVKKDGNKVKDTASKELLSAENPDTYVYKRVGY